jgi:hypothetical protein
LTVSEGVKPHKSLYSVRGGVGVLGNCSMEQEREHAGIQDKQLWSNKGMPCTSNRVAGRCPELQVPEC